MNSELHGLLQLPAKLGSVIGIALLIASSAILLLLGVDNIGLATLLAKLGFGFILIGAIANMLQWVWTVIHSKKSEGDSGKL